MKITNTFNNKIDTRSLSEMTYEYIVNQILAGALVFGDVIKIDSIACLLYTSDAADDLA